MFPQLRERFGSALDLVVEFSTLGEYRLDADGVLCPASALARVVRKRPAQPGAQRPAPEREPQLGGLGGPNAGRAAVRRIVAGGAAGTLPAATPAARRLAAEASRCRGERRHQATERRPARPRTPVAPEQLCLAV
jgi:hypothetical protein